MKKILIPFNEKQIDLASDYVDGYIIGIDKISVNTYYNITLDKLDNLDYTKEIFISLNKNIENNDIPILKDILIKLNKYPIKGILYSDPAFINLKNKLKIKHDLILSHEHFNTNYETINYWNYFGINYVYLSSDITLNDIIQIKKNTNTKLLINIFGYLPMFVSKRHIVKNYLKKFNIDNHSDIYYMEKENKIYPIVDSEIGTFAYSNNIFNGLSELKILENSGIEYGVINGLFIEDDILLKALKGKNIQLSNMDTGFYYQDTVSRVKK